MTLGGVLLFPHFFDSPLQTFSLPLALTLAGGLVDVVARLRVGRTKAGPPTRRLLVIDAILVGLLTASFVLTHPARSWKAGSSVLLLAIDGASWDVIETLDAAGDLPNLRSMMRNGVRGSMQSFEPSYSPVVWTTIASGVSPEAHGITTFFSTQQQLRAKRLWEILAERGQRVGLFRWWATWPPKAFDGFVVPDILALSPETVPTELEFVNQLRIKAKSGTPMKVTEYAGYLWNYLRNGLRFDSARKIAMEVGSAWLSGDGRRMHVAKRRTELRLNADVFLHLLRRTEPRVAAFYDNGVDVLSHSYWMFHEPEHFPGVSAEKAALYGGFIPDYYRLVDEVLGRMRAHLEARTSVFFLSDHGFQAASEADEKLIVPAINTVLSDLGLDDRFFGISLANRTYVESLESEPARRDEEIEQALELLQGIFVAGTGQQVFDPELRPSGRIRLFIHSDVPTEGRVDWNGEEIELGSWISKERRRSGDHRPEAVLVATGPPLRSGHLLEGATVLDIAPTILYLLELPVAKDMEGRVLTDAFHERVLGARGVEWIESYGRLEPTEDRLELDEERQEILRSLGYVQ